MCWNLFPKAGQHCQQPSSQRLRLRLSSTYRLWASLTSGLSPPLSLHSHPELRNWFKTHSFNHTLDAERALPIPADAFLPSLRSFPHPSVPCNCAIKAKSSGNQTHIVKTHTISPSTHFEIFRNAFNFFLLNSDLCARVIGMNTSVSPPTTTSK